MNHRRGSTRENSLLDPAGAPWMAWAFTRGQHGHTNQRRTPMSELAFLYRGRETNASPERMQKTIQKWMVWFKDLREKGHIADIGHPLEDTGSVVRGKEKAVHDGPYAEAKDVVGGFTLIQAKDLAQASELAKGCPILEVGGSVEVRPLRIMNL
jgi:hypothetical protein